ncbi:hypothetical protein M0802_002185 [Mischocyttarus mexicanus]|nr:hypothetical protein M0802_002185 [Mischocyttarus mexicanus]
MAVGMVGSGGRVWESSGGNTMFLELSRHCAALTSLGFMIIVEIMPSVSCPCVSFIKFILKLVFVELTECNAAVESVLVYRHCHPKGRIPIVQLSMKTKSRSHYFTCNYQLKQERRSRKGLAVDQ